MSFLLLCFPLWALVLWHMFVGLVVLLRTMIRLIFCFWSFLCSSKEKLLDVVFAELSSEKGKNMDQLYTLQLHWEKRHLPPRSLAVMEHSKPDDGFLNVDIEAPNNDSIDTPMTQTRQVQDLVWKVSALARQSKGQEAELEAMLEEVKTLEEVMKLRAREYSKLILTAKNLYNWGPCSESHLLL